MNEKPLSKRQQSILQFTHGYMEEHGRPPTIREIGKAVGINSTPSLTTTSASSKKRVISTATPTSRAACA